MAAPAAAASADDQLLVGRSERLTRWLVGQVEVSEDLAPYP